MWVETLSVGYIDRVRPPLRLLSSHAPDRRTFCTFQKDQQHPGDSGVVTMRVRGIVTGDESWIYRCNLETNRRQRKRSGREVLAQYRTQAPLTGYPVSVSLRYQRSADAERCVSRCLPQVIAAVSSVRPTRVLCATAPPERCVCALGGQNEIARRLRFSISQLEGMGAVAVPIQTSSADDPNFVYGRRGGLSST
ncbi:hypothetical protein EVAR_87281_1 [Eumeta japonica]|uniref:Uncharacterized protein n=1 Tax=Eumeta variegata TaxID=151549 RepID=A0A4C1VX19_EUMVA|nr:hypothetical protein EVAR_87281_1 [Eumeta japonica]